MEPGSEARHVAHDALQVLATPAGLAATRDDARDHHDLPESHHDVIDRRSGRKALPESPNLGATDAAVGETRQAVAVSSASLADAGGLPTVIVSRWLTSAEPRIGEPRPRDTLGSDADTSTGAPPPPNDGGETNPGKGVVAAPRPPDRPAVAARPSPAPGPTYVPKAAVTLGRPRPGEARRQPSQRVWPLFVMSAAACAFGYWLHTLNGGGHAPFDSDLAPSTRPAPAGEPTSNQPDVAPPPAPTQPRVAESQGQGASHPSRGGDIHGFDAAPSPTPTRPGPLQVAAAESSEPTRRLEPAEPESRQGASTAPSPMAGPSDQPEAKAIAPETTPEVAPSTPAKDESSRAPAPEVLAPELRPAPHHPRRVVSRYEKDSGSPYDHLPPLSAGLLSAREAHERGYDHVPPLQGGRVRGNEAP